MKQLLLLSLVAVAMAGCSDGDSASEGAGGAGGGGPVDGPTYYADVKPLIDAKCANCHVEGGIGPFPLTTYAEVLDHKGAIKAAVANKTMPPWMAADDCNTYLNDRSLDDAQIDAIVGWADAGGLEGDPSTEAPPLDLGDTRALSRVDVELGMQAEFQMTEEPDEYRCFVLDWPADTDQFVTGIGVKPGNPAVVHHVIAFVATPNMLAEVQELDDASEGPGYPCFGGPGFRGDWLGAWAPGGAGYDYPPGTGIPVEAGSKIVMQVHYNSLTAGKQPDLTTLQIKMDDAVDHEAVLQPWTNPAWLSGDSMMIPAATKDVKHSWDMDPTPYMSNGNPMLIHSPLLHMHELGQSARLSIYRADGSETCLLDIPAWNFHWQGGYALKDPVLLQPGDRVHLECTWDNPTMNDIAWGEGTGDEMCLGGFYYTVP